MNAYEYKLSDTISTIIQATNILEADAEYEKLTGLNPQKAQVQIEFKGKYWNGSQYIKVEK